MKHFALRSLSSAAAAFLLFASAALPANASSTSPFEDSCSVTEVNDGECITAVVSAGEDPVVNGVIQQLQMGVPVDSVEEFVQRRGTHRSDNSQKKIQEIVQKFRNAPSKEAKKTF
ncbi:hypothetical protein [Arthrobacter sp. AG258]|uniref:hypothetical protein n=1 Tax=Arthrobacter sp. AG258 TaxID=2183899 RepID=UPI00105FB1C9|nr:hypothetical protein [Arthrobacter sp. AG258]